jgi:hypothetical protein
MEENLTKQEKEATERWIYVMTRVLQDETLSRFDRTTAIGTATGQLLVKIAEINYSRGFEDGVNQSLNLD